MFNIQSLTHGNVPVSTWPSDIAEVVFASSTDHDRHGRLREYQSDGAMDVPAEDPMKIAQTFSSDTLAITLNHGLGLKLNLHRTAAQGNPPTLKILVIASTGPVLNAGRNYR